MPVKFLDTSLGSETVDDVNTFEMFVDPKKYENYSIFAGLRTFINVDVFRLHEPHKNRRL